jgi:hypothetical protein
MVTAVTLLLTAQLSFQYVDITPSLKQRFKFSIVSGGLCRSGHFARPLRPVHLAALRPVAAVLLVITATPAFAQQMVGMSLMTFAANSIIAPLGIFAVVVALASSFFRPDIVKGAVYAAIICAVVFFVIRSAPQIMQLMQN